MGVLNVTPDSFSDGGLYAGTEAAVRHAHAMAEAGADILDIGGESTRPATFGDKTPLPAEEEKRRILPVIARLAAELPDLPLSVDTYKAEVAAAALDAGAQPRQRHQRPDLRPADGRTGRRARRPRHPHAPARLAPRHPPPPPL